MKVKEIKTKEDLRYVYDLAARYALSVHKNNPVHASYSILDEMQDRLGHDGYAVFVLIDERSMDMVGFCVVSVIDNYGDTLAFISSIYSDVGNGGRLLFGRAMEWAWQRGCSKLTGAVPWENWEASARLWGMKPVKVFVERKL